MRFFFFYRFNIFKHIFIIWTENELRVSRKSFGESTNCLASTTKLNFGGTETSDTPTQLPNQRIYFFTIIS